MDYDAANGSNLAAQSCQPSRGSSAFPAPPPPPMDVERIFHMKEGSGDTSYAQNFTNQRKALEKVKEKFSNHRLPNPCMHTRLESMPAVPHSGLSSFQNPTNLDE
ncbi:hypothetical protein H6P81_010094 [Aristolochia fimbriata]|uniref:Uncharacterized protein n=1 Tax=Aristolochia fimbriata TaxID=158543 RepID=A0AAV7EP13_ARIFI|nr:hypothetical protein H6P81_010094 [Aristolochia fimbriata]